MKHPLSQWCCEQCNSKYLYGNKKPKQILVACVWYGDRGIPPFTRPYNDSPIFAKFNYCEKCC